MHKVSPQKNKPQKKVQFDAARVSFQVEYDIPDDRQLRHKIPMWTEHWKKSKSGLVFAILRSVSSRHWIRSLVVFICFASALIQCLQSLRQYLRLETVVSADYRLPQHFLFPSVSLCVPFSVVPQTVILCHRHNTTTQYDCPTIAHLFNASSFGHRCKYSSSEDLSRVQSCSSPEYQWIHRNRKCFSYFAPTETSLSLFVESIPDPHNDSPLLYVHKHNAFPLDESSEALELKHNRDLEIHFFATTVELITGCHKYEEQRQQQRRQRPVIQRLIQTPPPPPLPLSRTDCFARCIVEEMRAKCVTQTHADSRPCLSVFAPLRHDLVDARDTYCSPRDHNTPCASEHAYIAAIETPCWAQCPPACLEQTFHLTSSESLSRDVSEANVTLRRRLTPDLTLTHIPRTTCAQLMAQLGGLCAFWSVIGWLWLTMFRIIQYFWEFIEIYCF